MISWEIAVCKVLVTQVCGPECEHQHSCKKFGVMTHGICDPSAGQVETGRSPGLIEQPS